MAPSNRRSVRCSVVLAVSAVVASASTLPAQGRVAIDTIRARTLTGNLAGDGVVREIYTYVPPSYDHERTRRYPVLYLLHGMTSHPREWLDGSYQGFDLTATMDSLARAGHEFLVVMPSTDNTYGGTFYVNSAAFGRMDDFIARELVAFTDGRYRTLRDRGHRGLAGQSMGGFGAISVALSHAATFASVYAMSPCCLAMVGDLAPDSPLWSAAAHLTGRTHPRNVGESIVRALATVFSPVYRPDDPLALPFVVTNGTLRASSSVLRTWHRFMPIDRLAQDPASMQSLCRLAIEFGASDQIPNVPVSSRAFSAALTRAGVEHTLEVYPGGHVDQARVRFERHLLPFFASAFDRAGGAAC